MTTPDLITILKEKTEQKPDAFSENTQEQKQEKQPDFSDFEEVKKEEQPPAPEKEEKPRLSENDYEQSAEMVIATIDGIQTLTLPWLYQKSLFNKKELEQLKEIKAKSKKQDVTLSEEDLNLLDKYNTFEELKNNVSFTTDEIELLKTPLGKVFSKYNIQVGPELLLLSAVAVVMAPRYLPFISALED